MQLITVRVEKPEATNFVLGKTHFIKSVEDIHEALVGTVKPGTVILQSRCDDVIPFADCEELARHSGVTLIEVGTDHRLADLEAMLKA